MSDLYYEPKKREFKGKEILKELNRLLKNDLHYVSFLNENGFEIAQEVYKIDDKNKIELSKSDTFLIDYNLVVSIYGNEAFAVFNRTKEEQDAITVKNIERLSKDRMKLGVIKWAVN